MPGATEQFFARVLDYYRAPLSHPFSSAKAEKLPQGYSGFLDSLARPDERLAPIVRALGCDRDELLAASYFYLRETLFLEDGDHYRVLGLPADADIGEIRRRYRLLIGLFHPDRISSEEHWEEQYVRRLNRAYGVLKRPEKRRAYDRGLRRGKIPKKKVSTNTGRASWSGRAVQQASAPGEMLYRFGFLQRHPKFMIWLVLLLLFAAVLLVSMHTSRVTTLTQAAPDARERQVADRVPGSLYSAADLWKKDIPLRLENQASPAPVDHRPAIAEKDSGHIRTERKQTDPAREDLPRMKPEATRAPDNQASEDAQESLATTEPMAPETPAARAYRGFDGTLIPVGLYTEQPLPEGESGAAVSAEPRLQPEYVLMQYVRAYETGNMNLLLSLFTLEPKTNGGAGRGPIRNNYAQVFRQTRRRAFDIQQISIKVLDDDSYQMRTRVQVLNEAANGEGKASFAGEMIFRLIRKGRKLYIASLFHDVSDKAEAH